MKRLTTRFTTVATVGFRGAVSRDENRSAHGAVCHLQARRTSDGRILGRKVNSNGRHSEVGPAEEIDHDTLTHWQSIEAGSR